MKERKSEKEKEKIERNNARKKKRIERGRKCKEEKGKSEKEIE